jgi:hypothetical protein
MPVLQPFAALYVLILASASPLLAKESERIYGLFARLFGRLRRKKKADEEVEDVEEQHRFAASSELNFESELCRARTTDLIKRDETTVNSATAKTSPKHLR